ncbi:uncharacterized protein CTHT_0073740 [Thermochaetoides thermophila DSM 1495]|uniref:C2H2-type domain-containing protein n=1 Tax=Chaetomium thermophilum (strain DSM 1495 / CBS 144.50 / IMI 039719) TaxID=759272 RepID=G0SHX8_CHATD|nr:hypothetical protein CTHT_0073740 [Thermochaetoides thermophila DSM 1495]EGS17048.1 hypothetical protein CTHT_0073740 [Thermochaetoides thermophila DSM 1495]
MDLDDDSQPSASVISHLPPPSHQPQQSHYPPYPSDDVAHPPRQATYYYPPRPNRWTGPPSTWLTHTAADRAVWTSLSNSRAQDLSIHLYNAYGLRKRLRKPPKVPGEDEDFNTEEGRWERKRQKQTEWAPPARWTAWPVRAGDVPGDGLLPEVRDGSEEFGVRRRRRELGLEGDGFAGGELEEEISAAVLRAAGVRFRKRGLEQQEAKEGGQVMESAEQRNATEAETDGWVTGDEGYVRMGKEKKPIGRPRKKRGSSPDYVPTLCADDDRNYALVRPAVRRIMAKLDDTLMILHNARVAGLRNMSESDSDGEDEDDDESTKQEAESEGEKLATEAESNEDNDDDDNDDDDDDEEEEEEEEKEEKPSVPASLRPRNRGGRPRKKHVPLEGETEEEMLIRIARQNHRKVPTFNNNEASTSRCRSTTRKPRNTHTKSEPESETDTRRGRSRSRKPVKSISQSRSKSTTRFPSKRPASSRSTSRSTSHSRSSSASDYGEKRLGRWGLRDWRDVLGAAALAGFEPAVLARAAQRCANLFGEEMVLHTLREQPVNDGEGTGVVGGSGIETVRYVPGGRVGLDEDWEESEEDFEEVLAQRRTVARQPSLSVEPGNTSEGSRGRSRSQSRPRGRSQTPALQSLVCPHETCYRSRHPFTRRDHLLRHLRMTHGEQPERSRTRSRSRTPGPGHRCPHADCDRAVDGFSRRTNLVRHLRLVHGDSGQNMGQGMGMVTGDEEEEEDSADEVEGGVHVDRFLKPIKPRKGWRAEDKGPKRVVKRRRGGKKRRCDEESEELDTFLSD